MSLQYPTRRGGSSITLVVTFFLGLLIGAVLVYAVADSLGWDFSVRAHQSNVAQDAPAAPPAQEPKPAAPPTPEPSPAVETPTPPPVPAPVETPVALETPAAPPAQPEVPDADLAKHLMVDIQGTTLDDAAKAALAALQPGIVVLRAQNVESKEQTLKLVAEIKAAAGGEGLDAWPLIAISQEGGDDNPLKLKDAPSAKSISAIVDFNRASDAARKSGIALGAEARAWGIGVVLAPRLDVFDPKVSDASIEARSFGEDAQDAADLAASLQMALHEAGVIAVGKHFPGLGQAVKDDDGALSIPLREIRYLVQTLLPFSDAASNGIPGMLVAQVRVPGLEQTQPDLPAPLSRTMMRVVLREQLKFEGVAIADDVSSSPITSGMAVGEVTAGALSAGCDVVYIGSLDTERMAQAVAGMKAALDANELNAEALATGRARLERWREFLRLPPLAKPPVPKPDLPKQPEGTEKLLHRVARGETLELIAKKYGVSADDIAAWNGLKEKKTTFAQRLNIYVPKEKPAEPAKEEKKEEPKPVEMKPEDAPKDDAKPEEKTTEEKTPEAAPKAEAKQEDKPQEKKPDDVPKPDETRPDEAKPEDAPKEEADSNEAAKPEEAAAEKPVQLHLIVAGDTLRKIALKYNTTPAELMKMNKISTPDQILLGTKIKVPKQP